MDFDTAFEILIGHEGVLSLDRKDPGNWTSGKVGTGELKGTKYGVSAAAYPKLDIASLTLEEAKTIYKKDYWDPIKLDRFPPEIVYDLFDIAVNSGVDRSIKLLQRSLGVTEDGKVGGNTILGVNSIHPYKIKCFLLGNRLKFMTDLAIWDSQGKGWARRVSKIALMDIKK